MTNVSVNHHLVSKGYQKNFATSNQKLTVLNALSGVVIEPLRPTIRNLVAEHWNTYMDDDGKMNTDVETAYGRIEGSVMRRIREINFRNCDQKHHEAIVHLFAIHLVRSRSYNLFYESVRDSVLPRFVSEIVEDPRTDELFQAENGRSAVVGELRSIVTTHVDRMFRNKRDSVQSAVTTSGAIVGRLRGLHIQVIELDSSLPGFVLGDVPIVHANLEQKRFGFRDRLAIDDADLIMGPLSRRVLVCFTPDRVQSKLLRSKKKSQEINALLLHACDREVSCHPDDQLSVSRLCRQPHALRRP